MTVEYEIGKILTVKDYTGKDINLKLVEGGVSDERNIWIRCIGCHYKRDGWCAINTSLGSIIGACDSMYRTDCKNIIFVKID